MEWRYLTKCCRKVPNGLNCCPECGEYAPAVGTVWVSDSDRREPGKYERLGRKAGRYLDGAFAAVGEVWRVVRGER